MNPNIENLTSAGNDNSNTEPVLSIFDLEGEIAESILRGFAAQCPDMPIEDILESLKRHGAARMRKALIEKYSDAPINEFVQIDLSQDCKEAADSFNFQVGGPLTRRTQTIELMDDSYVRVFIPKNTLPEDVCALLKRLAAWIEESPDVAMITPRHQF